MKRSKDRLYAWKKLDPTIKPGSKFVIIFDENDRQDVKFLGKKRGLYLFKPNNGDKHTIYGLPETKVKKLVFSEE